MRIEIPEEFVEALAAAVAERLRGQALDHAAPLTVKEVASRLKVSESTAKIWIKTGRLRRLPECRRISRQKQIPSSKSYYF